MSIVEELIKLSKIIKKNKKSPLVIIAMVAITWMISTDITLEYKWKGIKLNIIIAIGLTIFELIWWVVCNLYFKKNTTNRQGIAFLICSAEIEKHDVEKENFFKMLKNECNDLFNILVYTQKDFKNFEKKYTINEIMKKLNLTILFEIKERKGNIDNDNNYEIEIIKTNIRFPYGFGLEFIPSFNQDFTKSINKHIKISHKNSLVDNKAEIGMLELSSLYITSIIQIISPNPEKSFELLDRISLLLHITKLKKSEYGYIEKNIPYRYLEAYQNTICKLLVTEKYYENSIILNRIKDLQDNMFNYLIKIKTEGKIEKYRYKLFYEDYLLQRAIIIYEESGPLKALDIINKCDFTTPNNCGAYFSKAFLLMMCGKIEESVKTYIKLLKRKDLEQLQVEEILIFIDNRQKIYSDNIYLKFCYGIINFFRKDKKLAFKIFDEIKFKNNVISKQIEEIIKYDIR